jgi:hypothetical protein
LKCNGEGHWPSSLSHTSYTMKSHTSSLKNENELQKKYLYTNMFHKKILRKKIIVFPSELTKEKPTSGFP